MISFLLFLLLFFYNISLGLKLKSFFILSFVFFLPINSLIPSSESFGFEIKIDNLISILALFSLLAIKSSKDLETYSFKKNLISLMFFSIFINYYFVVKDDIFFKPLEYSILKGVIKDLVNVVNIILIIKNIDIEEVNIAVGKGIILTSIVIGFSIFFSQELNGLNIPVDNGYEYDTNKFGNRPTGVIGGDSNVAGMVCVMLLLFILVRLLEEKEYNVLTVLGILSCFLGILTTASRAAFLSLGICTFLIGIRQIKKNNLILLFLMMGIFLLLFGFFGELLFERLQSAAHDQDRETLGTRLLYWAVYSLDLVKNPEYLLFGNFRPPPIMRNTHNFYLKVLYSGGFFAFIFFILKIKNLWNYAKYFKYNLYYFYPMVACMIVIFTISDPFPVIIFLIIALSIPQIKVKLLK